mgnify:CR=1 FL=1
MKKIGEENLTVLFSDSTNAMRPNHSPSEKDILKSVVANNNENIVIKLIKIFNRQQEKQEECEKITQEFKQTIKPNGYLQGLMHSVMFVIENLGISILIGFIINQYLGIELNIGVIYMFITYFKNIFEPINRLLENIEVVEEKKADTKIKATYLTGWSAGSPSGSETGRSYGYAFRMG